MIGIINTLDTNYKDFKALGQYYNPFTLPVDNTPIIIKQIEWLQQKGCSKIKILSKHCNQELSKLLEFYSVKNVSISNTNKRILSEKNINSLHESVMIINSNIILNRDSLSDVKFDKNFYIGKNNKSRNFIFVANPKTFLKSNLKKIKPQDHLIVINNLKDYLSKRPKIFAREFNDIKITKQSVKKSSFTKREKIIDEYNWFNNIPENLKRYCPKILDKDLYSKKGTSYTMERLYHDGLDQVMLYETCSSKVWSPILRKIFRAFKNFNRTKVAGEGTFMYSMYKKTKDRIKQYPLSIEKDQDLIDEFMPIFEKMCVEEDNKGYSTIIHGDFCFGNMMHKKEDSEIKLIDPRGALWGSYLYEMAKLYKSAVYPYYYADYQLYSFNKKTEEFYFYDKAQQNITRLFNAFIERNFTKKEIKNFYITVASLFLSMVPYHPHSPNNQLIYYKTFEKIFKFMKANNIL